VSWVLHKDVSLQLLVMSIITHVVHRAFLYITVIRGNLFLMRHLFLELLDHIDLIIV
jgi:hypothetical protein